MNSNIRPIHGLVRVGFVPNPESTRPRRVFNIQTRRRPLDESVRATRISGMDRSVIGRTRGRRNQAKSSRNWPKSARSGRNMAGSSKISKRTHQILKRSRRALEEISPDLKDLLRSRRDLAGSQRTCQEILIPEKIGGCFRYIGGRIGWNRILKSRPVNRPAGLGFWRLKPTADRHRCRADRYRVRIGRFASVWSGTGSGGQPYTSQIGRAHV